MSEMALTVEFPTPPAKLTDAAEAEISAALDACALIGRVSNETENKVAVEAAINLKRLVNSLEKTRTEIIAPALAFQRRVNEFFKARVAPLNEEVHRICALTGDYIQLEAAKARAAEQARKEELTRLERERAQSLASAQTHEEMESVREYYDRRAATETAPAPIVTIPQARGQTVGGDLEVTVTDIWALAKAQPSCVNPPTPRLTEIKALIRAGVKLPGVEWREVVKVGLRARTPKTIDV